MRIGIDARYIHDHFPGIGRYTYNLILALAATGDETFVVVHNPALPNTRFDVAALGRLPGVELVASAARPFSLAEQWQLPRLAGRLKLDVWHAPYYIAPYRLPCPLVVTVHDAISSRYPQYLPSLAARLSYEATMRLALGAAQRVIAVSQASADDVVRFFGTPRRKISVVHEAADARYCPQPPAAVAALRERLGLPERYVLYLGMNKPHKNLARLVQAWASVVTHHRGLGDLGGVGTPQLVIAGRTDPRYPQAHMAAQRLGLAGAVRFLGDVAEADLPALYSGADVFVFPSLYEGFGLPPLEAMACGAPVLCAATPALQEVVGDAALTFDPVNVEELAHVLLRVLGDADLRADLSQRGLVQAQRFSWKKAAQETLIVYRQALRR
jgi:alpha-1,3-rhamnosyl/mannosyltransferase